MTADTPFGYAVDPKTTHAYIDLRADRDRLASLVEELIDWFQGAGHHPGCSGAFPPHRCKCGRDRLADLLADTEDP